MPAEACLSHDCFSLTVSQNGVVKNSIFEDALKELERILPARIERLLAELDRRRKEGVPVPAPWRLADGLFPGRLAAREWPPVGWRPGRLGIMIPDQALQDWERAARGD